jgi:hypothetical protein
MSRKTFTPMGALHPLLFFAGVYFVVLLFSIFICSTIFYSCNSVNTEVGQKQPAQTPSTVSTSAYLGSVAAIH